MQPATVRTILLTNWLHFVFNYISARAQSIELVSKALDEVNGSNAAALAVAEKYVSAFQELAKTNNTLILPSNTGDVSAMVAQVSNNYA